MASLRTNFSTHGCVLSGGSTLGWKQTYSAQCAHWRPRPSASYEGVDFCGVSSATECPPCRSILSSQPCILSGTPWTKESGAPQPACLLGVGYCHAGHTSSKDQRSLPATCTAAKRKSQLSPQVLSFSLTLFFSDGISVVGRK